MDKIFRVLLKIWGDVGYLYYDTFKSNNSTKLTLQEKQDTIKLINILHDNINNFNSDKLVVNDKFTNDYINSNDQLSDIVEVLCNHINENFITMVFNLKQKPSNDDQFFIKFINIDSFDEIEDDRWMSFSESNTSINSMFGDKVIIMRANNILHVNTLGICDRDEVLINSNEVKKIINDEDKCVKLNDDSYLKLYNIFYDLCDGERINEINKLTLDSFNLIDNDNVVNLIDIYDELLKGVGVIMKEFNYYYVGVNKKIKLING